MTVDEPVVVYTVKDPHRADVIRLALEAAGIRCRLGGEGQMGLTGVFDIDVLVRAVDSDRARRVIESHEERAA